MIDHFALWTELPWVSIDVETTGFSCEYDRLVELALVRFERGKVVSRWSSLINPQRDVPWKVQQITGIKPWTLRTAPTFVDIVPFIVPLLDGAVPVAYSAPFDRRMLLAETDRLGLSDIDVPAFSESFPWVDPLPWVRSVDRFVKPGTSDNKLASACKRWGITLDGAHRAEADAVASGELLWAMSPRIGRMTVSEMLRKQRLVAQKTKKPVAAGGGAGDVEHDVG